MCATRAHETANARRERDASKTNVCFCFFFFVFDGERVRDHLLYVLCVCGSAMGCVWYWCSCAHRFVRDACVCVAHSNVYDYDEQTGR